MKTIATLITGVALGATLFGIVHTAAAAAPASSDALAREQVQALQSIADELRQIRQGCGR